MRSDHWDIFRGREGRGNAYLGTSFHSLCWTTLVDIVCGDGYWTVGVYC